MNAFLLSGRMRSCVGTIGNAARPDIRKGALTMIALQGQGPNSEGSEEVRRSFQESMAERNGAMHRADRKESSDRNPEAYFAPRLDSPEPSINRDQQTATEENIGNSTSVGSRVRRTMVRGFILAALLGLAWQASRDDQAGDMIKSLGAISIELAVPSSRRQVTTQRRFRARACFQIVRSRRHSASSRRSVSKRCPVSGSRPVGSTARGGSSC